MTSRLSLRPAVAATLAVLAVACQAHTSEPPATTTAPSAVAALITPVSAPASGGPAPPKAGECRRDGSLTVKSASWDDQPMVPCAEAHGLETWKVTTLPERWQLVPHLPTGDHDLARDFTKEVRDACPPRDFARWLRVPSLVDELGTSFRSTPVTNWSFRPTPAQWAAGARWIRCDAGLRWSDPDGSLPPTLRGPSADAIPPIVTQPRCEDRDRQDVPCDLPHTSEVVADYDNLKTGRPDTEATETWSQRCARAVNEHLNLAGSTWPEELTFYYRYPFPETWDAGNRFVQCWLTYRVAPGNKQLRQWVGPTAGTGSRVPPEVP